MLTPNSLRDLRHHQQEDVKSNASSTQPNHAAENEAHWPRVGSFHHGMFVVVVVLIVSSSFGFHLKIEAAIAT